MKLLIMKRTYSNSSISSEHAITEGMMTTKGRKMVTMPKKTKY